MFLCKRKILLLLALVTYSTLFGQEYLVEKEHYTIEDGLSSRFIWWMTEDSRGFVWLATQNGLNRFDGHEFKVYNKDNSNLWINSCNRVFEDVDGNLWLGYRRSSNSFNVNWSSIMTPDFEIIDLDEFFKGKLPVPSKEIHYVSETPTKDKLLILVTNDGAVYKYDGAFTKLAQDPRLKIKDFLHLAPSGELYYHSNFELLIAKIGTETQIIKKPDMSHIPMLKGSKIYWYRPEQLAKDPHRVELYNSTDTISLFPKEYEVDKLDYARAVFPNLRSFSQCFLYEEFLKAFNPKTGIIPLLNREIEKNFPTTSIESGYLARKNKYWFWDVDGLNLLTYKPNPFKSHFKGVGKSARTIQKMENGNFLIAPGIINLDIESGNYQELPKKWLPPTRAIVKLNNGKYLYGDYGKNLFTTDFKSKYLKKHSMTQKDREHYKGAGFLFPFQDSHGNILVGTDQGIVTFDKQTDSLYTYKKYNEFEGIAKQNVSWFEEYDDGIWSACWKGVFVLDSKKGITAWHHPMPDLRVEHFLREDSIFWLATYGEGLVKWNYHTGETKKYGLKAGLLDENLMAVYPDDYENLWVTTNWGLARFDKETETFNVYLKSDGLNHNEFNISSHFQDKDGTLYFGGVDGVITFNPNDFPNFEKDSITQFRLTGYKEIDSKSLNPIDKTSKFLKEKSIHIKNDVQGFILRFALLNYENTTNTRYAYKIDGLEDIWTLQKENQVKFNHLPFGKYTLRLKAIDYHGNESEEITIPLKVIAPFYRKLGWQILGLLLLLSFFGLAAWWRIANIRRKNENLELLVSQRTNELQTLNTTKDRLFAILAHDLRNPIIAFEELSETINYLIKKGDQKQVEKLGNYIEMEAKQIHHLMDNLLNWALSQRDELIIEESEFFISDFINDISKDYKHLEERTGVKIIPEFLSDFSIKSDKRILTIAARNIITNAFRYTNLGGWIKIKGFKKEEAIHLQFMDNGQGMTTSELENLFEVTRKFQSKGNISTISLGMHLCKELIKLLNGEIYAEAEPKKGTSVTIKIPVSP